MRVTPPFGNDAATRPVHYDGSTPESRGPRGTAGRRSALRKNALMSQGATKRKPEVTVDCQYMHGHAPGWSHSHEFGPKPAEVFGPDIAPRVKQRNRLL